MRKLATLTAAAALVLGFAGGAAAYHDNEELYDLQAGNSGGFDVGEVSVSNDANFLHVVFTILPEDSDWELLETHLVVVATEDDGSCDFAGYMTRKGNPKIGKFPNSMTHDAGDERKVDPYAIPLESLEGLGTAVCFAAHARVATTEFNIETDMFDIIDSESAWAEGGPMDGGNWSMYATFTLGLAHD